MDSLGQVAFCLIFVEKWRTETTKRRERIIKHNFTYYLMYKLSKKVNNTIKG